jgi:pyruvate dehydrogenase E2 component (dihydrolipoamide acetyltransferase)
MAETINMPKLGFDMAEGTLVRWLRKPGETIQKGEVLAEIETDKATVEVESTVGGTVLSLLADEGAVVPVNTPIAVIGQAGETPETLQPAARPAAKPKEASPAKAPVSSPVPARDEPAAPGGGKVKASPLARKIALGAALDISQIRGSGPGGRIVRRDIEALLQRGTGGQETAGAVPGAASAVAAGSDEILPLSRLRQAIGRRMTEAKTGIPHFYVTHEYRLDALLEMRAQFNKIVPEDEKISVNDFIVKAAALTLRQFPNLNASFQGESVLRHAQVQIGVAVAVEGGLLTVVCRDADRKSLRQIAADLKAMANRARAGKVRPEDIEGSTFSISNLGMFEVENFAAIINPPEAAILAVGSARETAVVEAGTVKPGWRMKATISVDHRLSDGAEAARFMQALALYLEEPLRLVI